MTLAALSVMVVEDHGFQRRLALRLLGEIGIERISEAADGHAALDRLGDGEPPDVVLVDLDMPGMDGIEFIGHLAQQRLARAVALVSALDPALLHTVQRMARGYGLHVLGVIGKPLTADKLRGMLAGYDAQRQAQAPEAPVEIDVGRLRQALAQGRIQPWFQAQVEFGNGKPVGAEALARWHDEDGRVVLPGHFIPLLEREGLIDDLTERILEHGCHCQQQWQRDGLKLQLSVNVPPSSLDKPGVADRYQQIVGDHGLHPSQVVLELTESSVLADVAHTLSVLARLRLKGFGLSIDDFGTGYSSLSHLSQIPFTELKIDRDFVAGAEHEPRKRAVVEASVQLARKLGLAVVAEGVETVAQWQLLAELGCGFAQGFLIARPVPAEALPDTLAQWRSPLSR
jgi:EAL domain-containing protein (putative c-di-GMP-specific phosphodiesterase class I)/FixJ family two-component response regulator